jgi:hypothetical protein
MPLQIPAERDEVELNLVDVTTCSPKLLAAIEQQGVPL